MRKLLLCRLWVMVVAIFVACVPLALPGVHGEAQMDGSITMEISPETIGAGHNITLTVVVDIDRASRGAQCGLLFDPRVFQVTKISEGAFYAAWAAQHDASTYRTRAPQIDNDVGRVSPLGIALRGASGDGPSGHGVLCVYDLSILPGVKGSSELTLTDVIVLDQSSHALSGVITKNVLFTMDSSTANESTTVIAPSPTPVPSEADDSIEPEVVVVSYDVNRDGVCDVRDQIALAQKLGQSGAPGWVPEDLNLDGVVDNDDVLLLAQHLDAIKSQAPSVPSNATTPSIWQPKPLSCVAPRPELKASDLWPGQYPPTPIEKKTKLGLGIYGLHAGDNALASLTDVKPGVIVLQDPEYNFVRRVRYLFPNALIIGRIYLAEQPLDAPEQRGAELADRIATLAVPYKGLVDAWIGYNEPVAHDDFPGYAAYNRLQVAFAKRLQNYYGIAAVAGNDPPGAIEPDDYPRYFGEAIRECQYFGIHSYGQPGDTSFRVDDADYYALRYRRIQAELLKAGINDTRMVLTEVGLAEGWRYRVSDQQMAEEFMWLADQTEQDPYVEGMAIFGAFVNQGWEHFNIAESRIPYILGEYQPRH